MSDEFSVIQRHGDNLPSNDFSKFESFLISLGLPTDNVIASPEERMRIMKQLPDFVGSLRPELKRDARYLSKFIAGSAIGLFDAALNYVWNEVIVNLRIKINLYGLDLFFDAAVGEKIRDQYNSEEDLSGIKDKTLLDTCRKLELINDLVYKKLSHILTMRNDIGSSHPNSYSINSFELLGWLQTCIDEVIQIRPSAAALTVKSIVDNLKKEPNHIKQEVVDRFESSIQDLSKDMTGNLLVTLFGIFTNEATNKIVQENILKLVPVIWEHSNDNVKYDLGEKTDIYKLSLNSERIELAERFFSECDGNRYLSLNSRIISLSTLSESLYNAHVGWDNFYHEPSYAREIMTFILKPEDIPVERQEKLIKTFLLCRIGNGVSYQNGVSPGAKRYYNNFFEILDNKQIIKLLSLLEDPTVRNALHGTIRTDNFNQILNIINTPLNSPRITELINYLIENHSNAYNIVLTKRYKDLTRGLW